MATLSEFFERAREEAGQLPVHRGDWPDWWSDGFAGDPEGSNVLVLMEGRADPSISMPHGQRDTVPDQDIAAIRAWIEQGVMPPALGLWWVHGIMLLLAMMLLAVQSSMHKRLFR